MREQQATFDRLGAVVVGVTFEPPARVARFIEQEAFPYPILSDPTRRAYAAFGLQRGRPSQLWTWRSLQAYVRGALRGRWPRLAHADIAQLGGDVILAPDGRIAFLHRSVEPADRPAVDEIVAVVQRVAAPAANEERQVEGGVIRRG